MLPNAHASNCPAYKTHKDRLFTSVGQVTYKNKKKTAFWFKLCRKGLIRKRYMK